MCYMCRLNGYWPLERSKEEVKKMFSRGDTQSPFKNEATYYNNLPSDFIPDLGEKVKKTYLCKRKCTNCGYEGCTEHPVATESPDRELCPNCKMVYFRRA